VAAARDAERVKLLYALSRNSIAVHVAAAILVAAWLWKAVARGPLLAWLAAMAAYLAVSIGLYSAFHRTDRSGAALRWERFFAAKVAVGGLIWGLLIWLLLPGSGEFQRLFVILSVCTVSLAAAGVLSPSRLAFYAFMGPTAALAAIPLVFTGSDGLAAAGWGVLIFIAMLFGLHDQLYRNLRLTLTKRFESEALALEQHVIFDSAAEAIGLVRPNYMAKCNHQWCELFGCTMEEAIGKPAWVWWPSYEYWGEFAKACLPTISQGEPYSAVVQLRRMSGDLFWAEISGRAVDPANLDLGVVWMGTDVTHRLHTESELKASEQRFRDIVALSSDWYWEQDEQFRFTRISGTVLEKIGANTAATLGKARWELKGIKGVTAEQWQAHRKALEAHLPFRDFAYEAQMPGGEQRWFSISGNPAYDENGDFSGYHGVGTDITERVLAAEQFRHLAHHDTLTGLPNRRLLNDRLEQSLALARRTGHHAAMMLLDLDDFKIINDTDGHSAGDAVLVTIAQRLRGIVRETDTIARLGGDEFVILLPEMAHINDARRVAEKTIEAVREPVEVGERQYVLGVSIGIAVFPEHAANAEGLLQRADIAMYEAKRMGGSGYRFSASHAAPGEGSGNNPPGHAHEDNNPTH
jgi:diguanylate cyclase (GGDEF)-like protein/PAS domain S-box-containing protein